MSDHDLCPDEVPQEDCPICEQQRLRAELEQAQADTEELRLLRQRHEALESKMDDACFELKEWRIRNPKGYVESALEFGRLRERERALREAAQEIYDQGQVPPEIDHDNRLMWIENHRYSLKRLSKALDATLQASHPAEADWWMNLAKFCARKWDEDVRHRPAKNIYRPGMNKVWKWLEAYAIEQHNALAATPEPQEGQR